MQDTAIHHPPQSLDAASRLALAAGVVLALAAVLAVATSASHAAVRHLSAQFQGSTRYVTLPPVEIVGRRELAVDAPAGPTRSAAAPGAGCVQPS